MTTSTLPPFDAAAEGAVLAALLLDDDALSRVRPLLEAEDFFREQNAWIYAACLALGERSEPVTIPTVAHELARAGRLDPAGGEPYLVELAGRYFTAEGVEAHARIVARDGLYRRLIGAAHQIAQLAYAGGPDAARVLSRAEALIGGLGTREQRGAVLPVEGALAQLALSPDARRLPSGYDGLNVALAGGLPLGAVTTIGALTNHGKTALLAGMAVRQAHARIPVAYLPIEGTRRELLDRMTDHIARVARSVVDDPAREPPRGSLARWDAARDLLARLPLYVPDEGNVLGDFAALEASVVCAARQFGAMAVYVDHIDALPLDGVRGQPVAQVVAGWMRRLQRLAIRLGVAVVVASQVNREASREGALPPEMHHLKESGAKEQASAAVLMVGLERDKSNGEQTPLIAHAAKVKGHALHPWARGLYLHELSGAVYEAGVDDREPAAAQAELEGVR